MSQARFLWSRSLSAILILALLSTAGLTAALGQEQEGLFLDSPFSGEPDEDAGEAVRRSRFVQINYAALVRSMQADRLETGGAARLRLNLFPDATETAVLDRVQPEAGYYSYIGRVEGDDASQVVLVVQNGIVAGSIRTRDRLYQVRYAGGDVHAVEEIDPDLLPPEAEPIAVEEAEAEAAEAAGADVADEQMAADDGTQIDVLVAYTPAARAAAGGTSAIQALINLGITETNQAYANSGAIQRVQLVRMVELSYTETGNMSTDLSRLRNTSDGFLDAVHSLRNTHGADLVQLIVNSGGYCGIAYVMNTVSNSFESSAFGVTRRTCISPNLSFAHEMGHNMGLQHDRYVNQSNSPYPYAHGYVNQAALVSGASSSKRWRTIMAYNNECSDAGFGCTRLMYFSNPYRFYTGDRMGVLGTSASSSQDGPADARRALNNTRTTVANFRATKTPPGRPTLISPSGTISDTTPTFRWYPVPDATWYLLYLRKGSVNVTTHIKWYTSSQVGCSSGLGTCSITPSPALTTGGYTWWVLPWNPAGYGLWSFPKNFTIAVSGFNSQFNGSSSPWVVHSGPWSIVSSSWFYTPGLDGSGSSVSYPQNFSNLDYRVRVWRNGSGQGNPTRIMIRGTPEPLGTTNFWNSGYTFQITRDGKYSVYKGFTSALQGFTATSAINQGSAWNEMRVVAIGTSLKFYINGTLVWSGNDSTFSSGRVGIGMYRGAGTTGNGLWVDYAVLTVPSADLDATGALADANGAGAALDRVSLGQRALNEAASDGLSSDVNGLPLMDPKLAVPESRQ